MEDDILSPEELEDLWYALSEIDWLTNTIKFNAMDKKQILEFIQARERQLWEEYLEARDANGNLHAVTKRHYAVWQEVNELINHITQKWWRR